MPYNSAPGREALIFDKACQEFCIIDWLLPTPSLACSFHLTKDSVCWFVHGCQRASYALILTCPHTRHQSNSPSLPVTLLPYQPNPLQTHDPPTISQSFHSLITTPFTLLAEPFGGQYQIAGCSPSRPRWRTLI